MAINFEAANMAGYNNPQIEVFKAIINFETYAITEAPSKAEIINCLSRGAIPAIICASPNGSEGYLLWLSNWTADNVGDMITFITIGLTLYYPPDSDNQMVGTGG